MRVTRLLPAAMVAAAITSPMSAHAQIMRVRPGGVYAMGGRGVFGEEARAVIGVTTSGAATNRDTLGLFVTSVRTGSPAEKAGIVEGDRIASVNGVSLKLSPADVGDYEMANVMTRRLTRELDRIKPGDDVDLRVYANGQTKSVKVKTVAPEDLYESTARARDNDRATIGIDIATTGTPRDTLGVFVMGVEDGGPAAKAGIEEGSRIASINGVDLRGRRTDDDDFFRSSNANRLQREITRLKPGDDVDLRVYYNGQYRNVKFKAGRVSDLPRRGRSVTILGGDHAMPLMDMRIDGAMIGDQVRRAMETAKLATGEAMAGTMHALGRIGNRVEW